jgi:hypothetical protein
MGMMGDDSATIASLGFSPAQVAQILAAHGDGSLSDQGYSFLLDGGVPVGQLADFLAQDPGASGAPAPTTSAAAAGVPNGAMLTYTGSWVTTKFQNANSILAGVINNLPSNGVRVLNSSLQAGILANVSLLHLAEPGQQFEVTLQLQVAGPGFAQASDVAAIVDHQVYVASGVMPRGSSAQVSSGSAAGSPAGAGQFATWLEQNAGMLLLGIAGIFVLPALVKKL